MKDDDSPPPPPPKSDHNDIHTLLEIQRPDDVDQDVNLPSDAPGGIPPAVDIEKSKDADNEASGDAKNDSEAETVVLTGKETGSSRKSITHDGKDEAAETQFINVASPGANKVSNMHVDAKASPKEATATEDAANQSAAEAGNSSNLSSTVSSPVQETRSSSRGISESTQSRSTPPHESDAHRKNPVSRKRKLEQESTEDARRQRRKAERSGEKVPLKRPQESRKTSHQDAISRDRSNSPPLRQNRATSTQSVETQAATRRRKPPAPLLVGHRTKDSEDPHADSDDSSSTHGPPHLRKLASIDTAAMSPAKLPHKKLRDRNGRTWLARACAADELDSAKARLLERPEDVDIADNAGNTPLQIAALEGNAGIVDLLLKAGCDTACKNIDLETPLIDAVENGHLEVVQLLLKAGLDPRQSNAKGEEPLDLVNSDKDNPKEIRAALLEAREKDQGRRLSEDHPGQLGTRDYAAMPSPRGSPPLPSAQSPPPAHNASRRRGQTRNDLLWVNPSPETLRTKAGKGDVAAVDHILTMNPNIGADLESVLLAARGGHDLILELIIAMGNPEQDPEPLRKSPYKPGFDTPMLAAIGRGNTEVIKLLLNQPGFDPTRRMKSGSTYYEIAEERQGTNWRQEYDMLKEAYNRRGTKRQSNGSPSKSRTSDPKKLKRETSSSSPLASNKSQALEGHPHDSPVLKKRPRDGKRESRDGPNERIPRKHLRVPDNDSGEHSTAVSDRESTPLGPPKMKVKVRRSLSEEAAGIPKGDESVKPRRRLMTGKDLRSDQEKRRRASMASEGHSASNDQEEAKSKVADATDKDQAKAPKVKKEARQEREGSARPESGKKRPRVSTSPQPSPQDLSKQSVEILKKKKKRRLDEKEGRRTEKEGEGTIIVKSPEKASMELPQKPAAGNLHKFAFPSDHDAIPRMAIAPTSGGTAPVANMGNPPSSLANATPSERTQSPASPSDQAQVQTQYIQDLQAQTQAEEALIRQQRIDQERLDSLSRDKAEEQARIDLEERQKQEQEELERKAVAKAEQEEADRIARVAREEEEARLAKQRQMEEAETAARLEREAEEARIERKRREEELQRRRIEAERIRREEQERRRAEQEERERVARIRMLEEEERQRRASLPNSLKYAAELGPEERTSPKEIMKWLPIYTVTGQQLDPRCDESARDERWIVNLQAAPILAVMDLDLSQCK